MWVEVDEGRGTLGEASGEFLAVLEGFRGEKSRFWLMRGGVRGRRGAVGSGQAEGENMFSPSGGRQVSCCYFLAEVVTCFPHLTINKIIAAIIIIMI
jgi:hypothetical protein